MDKFLEIKNLVVEYSKINGNKNSVIKAVDGVSFNIYSGEIYALAGESGCGKTTLSKCIMKLVSPKSGEIIFKGDDVYSKLNSLTKNYTQKVQMVFQNPYSSLDPKMKIMDILSEPLDINTRYNKKEKNEIIKEVLNDVGLREDCLVKYPHEFSGGQRQRVAIARALILNPELLIADEPVSALDASIQAQILNLLKELKMKRNLTILFISHDMNVIKYLADRVGIMNNGKLVEENYTSTIFKYPKENYTKLLLNSVPRIVR